MVPAQTAQQTPTPAAPVAPPQPPPVATYSDLYCAGFFSAEPSSTKGRLVGGEESETKSLFSDRDVVYLNQGTAVGIKAGDELQVVRFGSGTLPNGEPSLLLPSRPRDMATTIKTSVGFGFCWLRNKLLPPRLFSRVKRFSLATC